VTITTTDLDWVTFTADGHGEPCTAFPGDCRCEPLFLAAFAHVAGPCRSCGRQRYCLGHKDEVLRMLEVSGYFTCKCAPRSLWVLERIEAIR
jgi:hypothetical protein